MGGSKVALPKGRWELLDQRVVKNDWDVAVLRNSSEAALIPFMTVRVTRTGQRWKQNGCDGERKLIWRERFGTKSSDMTNQCSLLYEFGTYAGFKNYSAKDPDGWWGAIVGVFPTIGTFENEAFLVLENQVTVFGKRVVINEYFIRTAPLGSSTRAVREDFQAGQVKPIHTAIKDWSRELITASYDSFYEGKSPGVASFSDVAKRNGLARIGTDGSTTASTATVAVPTPLRWPNDPSGASEQAKLGWAYRRGTHVEVDYQHAFELFNRAAAQGNADGVSGLAWMYADGYTVPRDEARAVQMFRQLSDQGYAIATSNLGILVRDGRGISKDENAAFFLFEKAAKQGVRWGQHELGKMYRDGRATTRDNPFKSTGRAIGTRGMAPTTAATGQMIIFSAGSGQQALDKLGGADKDPNSVFTRTFLKEMEKPGLTVDRVLRNVRNQVVGLAKSVGHQQVPALYDQVVGDFYFKP